MTNEEKREILELLKKELIGGKKVYVEICRDGVDLPKYANQGDAGMDVRAAEDITIFPNETKIIPTGLKMAIPEDYELQVRPRSGLSLNTPLRIANSPGTIDSGYRDEIGIIISNISNNCDDLQTYTIGEKGNKNGIYIIKKGDRIAQIVLSRYEKIKFEQVDKGVIRTLGINRGGGFGHTGTR